jgi:hypothetical protein
MAPSKYGSESHSPVLILQQGIDSIWLNIYGVLKEDTVECLAMAKEDAQAAAADEALSPLPPFDGTTPLMLATGVKYYEWHARSSDVDVQIRKPSKRSPRPAAVVRVSAEALWRLGDGGKRAALLAAEWLRPIFEDEGYRVTVSKVHLATDYQGYVPVLADLENVVSRAGDEEYFDDGDETDDAIYRDRKKRLTGVASGKSNNLRLNFYDKVLQARKKGLTWVADLWARCEGYQAGVPTWRNEFQYGRAFLHDRGIETLEDLFPLLGGLWAHAMGWYTFRVPAGGDTNRSRWPVADWWLALSRWGPTDAGELPKVRVVLPKLQRLCQGFAGYLRSVMAVADVASPGEGLKVALDVVCAAGVPLGLGDGGRLLTARAGMAAFDKKLVARRLRYAGFTLGT